MTKQHMKYICIHIIFVVIMYLCIIMPPISATVICDQWGIFGSGTGERYAWVNDTHNTNAYVMNRASFKWNSPYCNYCIATKIKYFNGSVWLPDTHGTWACYNHHEDTYSKHQRLIYLEDGWQILGGLMGNGGYPDCYNGQDFSNSLCHCYDPNADIFTISGSTCNITSVNIYILNDTTYLYMNETILTETGDTFSFNIVNRTSYKINFSDNHEYEFICNNNIVYNRNMCAHSIFTLSDDCGNMLENATTTIFKNNIDQIYYGIENPITIYEAGNYNRLDKLNVFIDTHNMAVEKIVYADDPFNTFNLYHNIVHWNLHTYVYDESDHLPLNNVKVTHSQPCRINGYDPNTYGFTNVYGFVSTPQLSNQNFSIKCEKEGYTTFEHEYNSNFAVWNPTYRINIDMAPDGTGTGNTTLPDLPCQIGCADDTGILISDITDAENVRLYYRGGNCSNILTWEKRDTVNHVWVILQQWNIAANENGFKQFTPVNWTEGETTRYRGTIFGYTCGCDASTDLTVTNSFDPQTVVNLTAGCFFRHVIGGTLMNPSSPIHILSYASSNNTTLVNIRLDLYNESVLVNTISYDFFDYYDGSEFIDLQWEPNYKYAEGFNYSVYMYCICEDVLVDLDTCYTNATGDNPFNTGNALTIKVYDHNSLPLQYSTIYVESWGSMDTEATNKVTFNGLGDDTYEYRAIKSGYLDRGFKSVTLSADATVSYILDIIDTEHAVRDIRMGDTDIKAMLYPIVFFILIMLLVGVLIDAVN